MKRVLYVVVALGALAALPLWQKLDQVAHANVVTAVATAAQATAAAVPVPEKSSVDQDAPYYESCAREGLNELECVGRLIWYKATAGNDRFHTYTFQQRIGVLIDWFRVLRTDQRDDRFRAWGIINDPACCKPGDENCPAKSRDETYGLDWCPGDDVLLKYVGKDGYVDPACGLKDAPLSARDPHTKDAKSDQRQSACDLKFGTSTGALGIRKFPNPRFDLAKWKQANSLAGTWDGFRKKLITQTGIPSDERVSKLADASVEPPFLIGTACGSCHIAFDPLNPPEDTAHPKWENIKGLVGNQYTRMSEILGSGMPKTSLEWQMFTHARPGSTDTSAISHDQVNNPGTINAIINLAQRPLFADETILKWRKAASCGEEKDEDKCWCEPGRDGKCWQKDTRKDDTTLGKPGVYHILKGGEDSIGGLEAIQRVYFNIGSCSEQCWVNHFTDFRQVDSQQRGFGQTPFNIGQCRRDCPNFRAIEDRLESIFAFFLSAEADATDLHAARERQRKKQDPNATYTRQDLIDDLNKEFGPNAVERGKGLFAGNCAGCHSSIPETDTDTFKNRDFYAVDDSHPRKIRKDFLGNDKATLASEVKTFRCRALHSNHMAGHLYQEYASETLRQRASDPGIPEQEAFKTGGRGYYRNISLLNAWATAPFMHNNAIGPELCGKPSNKENDFFRARYVDDKGQYVADQPCFEYTATVEGRFDLYKQSMRDLLNPKERKRKETLTDQPVILDMGLRLWDGKDEKALLDMPGKIEIPAGIHAGFLNGFLHKQFIGDLFYAVTKPERLEQAGKKALVAELQAMATSLKANPAGFVQIFKDKKSFIEANYSTCMQEIENEGHPFGEGLTAEEKNALTAFLATL
jgi:hypothetical protein